MPQPSVLVTAAEISRMAGVTRATVSNWRRRHGDFPAASGGTEVSPLYDLEAVRGWLDARGQSSTVTASEELRTVLRLHGTGTGGAVRLFPFVLAASRCGAEEFAGFEELSDADVVASAAAAAASSSDSIPDAEAIRFRGDDAGALRAVMRCIRDEGAPTALDVLAERELDDTASSGTYRTPVGLADLMARFLPEDAARVLDPACGSGTLLAAAARRGATELYGQDALPVQAQRSAVRLSLSAPDAQVTVRAGDSLRADAFPEVGVTGVLCNPPYGDRDWGHEELAYDQRWAHGVPPRGESELAWVQHALAHLEPDGIAVMVLPPATAARASGRRIRAGLVRSGALRAVVGLPVGAAVPLHIGLHVWILRSPESAGPQNASVLFVDVSGDRGEATSSLGSVSARPRTRRAGVEWNGLSDEIIGHWTAYADDPDSFVDAAGVARAVPTIDLVDDLVDLTPARHVRSAPVAVDPADAARRMEEGRASFAVSLDALGSTAAHGSWRAAESSRTWRTATVSDLARGGALSVLRAAVPGGRGDSRTGGPDREHAERPVLTASDVGRGAGPSATAGDVHPDVAHLVVTGDVLLRAIAGGGGLMVRVADETDSQSLLGHHIHLLRPDPARLDPWFLAGFLGAPDNIAAASTGSTVLQVSPGRLRVPLIPLEEQQRYGAAFRYAYELRAAARRTADRADELAQALLTGLTAGTLLPPPEGQLFGKAP